MDAGVAAVWHLLSYFAHKGPVKSKQPGAAEFEAVAVVLSRGEPESGITEDIADNAPYLDSVSDNHVLLALPALPMEKQPYNPSEDYAGWFSEDEIKRRWKRLLEFTGKPNEERRDELKRQLGWSANQLRNELGLSDDALPGILFAIPREKKVILIRAGDNFLKPTDLFRKLKRSYTEDPGLPLSRRLTDIAEQVNMTSFQIDPPKIPGFADWSAVSFDFPSGMEPTTRRTVG